jgi:ADP-heptose:LPS heptosyltransferase
MDNIAHVGLCNLAQIHEIEKFIQARMKTISRIIISRTDSIGDVMLTLPLCGWIKKHMPECTLIFLGRAYTRAIAEACEHIDEFMDWDSLKHESPGEQVEAFAAQEADCIIHVFPRKEIMWVAKRAGIAMRIASGHRLHALTKCNKLVFFSRKNSDLHESQLNFKLLKPLGLPDTIDISEIVNYYGFRSVGQPSSAMNDLLERSEGRKRIVLHPLSKGSAVDWPIEKYRELIVLLPESEFAVYITGTAEEGQRIREQGGITGPHVYDATGVFDLAQLIGFIEKCDALVAASTGPLHISAALGKHAIGLYSPKRPIHPGRWRPVGKRAQVICASAHPKKGASLSISADEVLQAIQRA